LIASVAALKKEIDGILAKRANLDSFLKLVERFQDVPELTPEVAREFVKKIVVHEPIRPEGKKKTVLSQEVHIYFNHIGEYEAE
jgi:hypothetical protein